MNKKIFLFSLIFLLMVALLSGCGGNNPTDEVENTTWNNYSNSNFGIQYPSEWEKTEQYDYEYDETLYKFYDPNSNSDKFPALLVVGFDIGYELDKNEFMTVAKDMKENSDMTTILEEYETTVNNQSAYKFITEEYQYQEENSKEINLYTYKNNRFYIIWFKDRINNFENTKSLANKMINSFEFLK